MLYKIVNLNWKWQLKSFVLYSFNNESNIWHKFYLCIQHRNYLIIFEYNQNNQCCIKKIDISTQRKIEEIKDHGLRKFSRELLENVVNVITPKRKAWIDDLIKEITDSTDIKNGKPMCEAIKTFPVLNLFVVILRIPIISVFILDFSGSFRWIRYLSKQYIYQHFFFIVMMIKAM